MLLSLRIKNIALIEECFITLDKGLNILSGETGAGKSIVIDSLSFVLGGRADKSLIRYGQTSAQVEGVFSVDESFYPIMEDLGLEVDDTLIIKRTMTESRNEVKVNGHTFTLSMLKRLTSQLADILGQHEHQSLLKVSNHLGILDRYNDRIGELKGEFKQSYDNYRSILAELDTFGDEGYRERRKDTLLYQIEEIKKADPKPDEEEELLKQREKYRNAERLLEGVSGAYNALEGEASVGMLVSEAINSLRSISRYDDSIRELEDRLDSIKIDLSDIADELQGYGEDFDFDERLADRVERRVDELKRLKKKYGATISDVIDELDRMQEEYDELQEADEKIEKLTIKLSKAKKETYLKAEELSKERKKTAKNFESAILKELSCLAMKGTMFEVLFKPVEEDKLNSNGIDDVEFMISPNVGEPLKELAKIASGGEMSRFMLALESVISKLDNIQTLVFDEIDTGISGRVAETVAEKLSEISVTKQVIAVTHLPQLASFSDNHYLINKFVKDGKTHTELKLLNLEEKISEVARLAGAQTELSKAHAKEMVENADIKKKGFSSNSN